MCLHSMLDICLMRLPNLTLIQYVLSHILHCEPSGQYVTSGTLISLISSGIYLFILIFTFFFQILRFM